MQGRGPSQRPKRSRANHIYGDDRTPPVEPVHVNAADQPEQQPWQLLGERRQRHRRRVVGDGGDQHGAGHQGDPVAHRGDGRRGPERAKSRAERRGFVGMQGLLLGM